MSHSITVPACLGSFCKESQPIRVPQHTKMYFITPQSKMASWINILFLPSLDRDTKQTHNKPSSTAQVRKLFLGPRRVVLQNCFSLLFVRIKEPETTIWGQRRLMEMLMFLKKIKCFIPQYLSSGTAVSVTWSGWMGQCLIFALPRRVLRRLEDTG